MIIRSLPQLHNPIILMSRENSQETLIAFLEKQLEQQQQLEAYYERQLAELKNGPLPPSTLSNPSKPSPNRNKTLRVKTEEVSSIMDESAVSIVSQAASKAERKEAKKDPPSVDMEYHLLSKQLAKMLEGISNKDAATKKPTFTPRRNSSFTNKSTLKPTPVVPEFKMTISNISATKSEREAQPNHARDQLLSDLGDSTLIVSNDEVVSKLVSNLRVEEERLVDALQFRSKMSAKSKMRNYLQHLGEKNEETLFKLRQKAIDRSLSRLEANRETVRNGYTRRMKDLIESGLAGKPAAKA